MADFTNKTDAELLVLRETLTKKVSQLNNLQLAKKVSLNSAYGATGSKYFRFYDLRLATSVTLAGQLSIRWIERKINDYINKILDSKDVDYVIASDTDSIYLRMEEIVVKFFPGKTEEEIITLMDKICEEKIKPVIDKSYGELAEYVNAYEQKMRMKRESLANRGVWTAKKRYILNVFDNEGVRYTTPHMKIMGLEVVKSSTPGLIRVKMNEAINLVVNGTESDVQNLVVNFFQEFKQKPVEEISFPRGLGGLDEYASKPSIYKKGTPIHIKGALLYNSMIDNLKLNKKYPKIKEGDKVKFTYLRLPNPIKDKVISFPDTLPPEFGLNDYVDYETQFEKTFTEPLQIILTSINWNVKKTNTLWD